MTRASTRVGSTIPVPSVWATCSPKNRKAMKLKKAAQNTAYRAGRTRVETMVAIELAASCRPFRKSKSSAKAISPMTRDGAKAMSLRIGASHVLDHDRVDLVGNV